MTGPAIGSTGRSGTVGLHRSGRAAGGLVTVAAVTVGLAATLGAGYTVADATLTDSSANVSKGTAVAHVNGESRRIDALSKGALGRRGDGLDVTTLPSGQVVVVNRKTNAVTTLDGSTMTPSSTPARVASGQVRRPSSIVVSGSGGWVVDYDASGVRRIIDGAPQDVVKVSERPDDAAPAQNGGVIVLLQSGKLVRVDTAENVHPIDADNARGAGLTRAGDKTYLVRTSGEIDLIEDDSLTKVADVGGLSPGADGRVVTGSLQALGPLVLVVSDDLLAWADPDSGDDTKIALHSGAPKSLGRPVQFGGKAYIPDYSAKHRVLVVDLQTKKLGKPIKVPGDEKDFALFVSGGKLWANDQYAQHLLVFDKNGGKHEVDKGVGNGTKNENRKPPKLPTTTGTGGGVGTSPTGGSGGSGGGNTTGNGGNGGSGTGKGNGGGAGTQKPKLVTVPTFPAGTDYTDACKRIQALGPSCNPVSREDDTRDSDELIETKPTGGQKVPEDGEVTAIFVGPLAVPAIPQDYTPAQACDLIEQVKLTCKLVPSAEPATDPALYGKVGKTTPAADAEAKTGDEITVPYYDSFTLPQWENNSTSGTQKCTELQGLSLQLEGKQPVTVQCTAPAGNPVPKNQESLAGIVYDQNVDAGQTYKPGPGSQAIVLNVYNTDAELKDYPGQGTSATDAANDCNNIFNCSVSGLTEPALANGGFDPNLVGKVQRMTDGADNQINPGKYKVGSQTTVKMVAYRGNNDAGDHAGQDVTAACNDINARGFKCNPINEPRAGAAANIVYEQVQKGDMPMGGVVDVKYFKGTLVQIHKYVHPDGKGGVYYLTAGGPPNVAGIEDRGVIATAYVTGSTGVNNWGLYQQTGKDCSSSHPGENVIYTHGQGPLPGCNGGWQPSGTVADLFYPLESSGGNTCGYGMVWLYRTVSFNSEGDRVHDYSLGGPDKNTPGETESIGCVYGP